MKNNESIISYKSNFHDDLNINLIFKENPNYEQLKEIFSQYGYGFLIPEFKTIIIDGEIFLGENGFTMDDMKFIEAHEIAHFLLGHKGPRSKNDEIEADLGAYILLKKNKMSTERLEDEFEYRHGVSFSENLLNLLPKKL